MKGKLYLIPVPIGDTEVTKVLPPYIKEVICSIGHFIVENERTARRMLIKMGISRTIDELTFYVLDKHTPKEDVSKYFVAAENSDIGLLSEAGVPAVADPGSTLVAYAHNNGITVVPLVGPSSILLAVMASGLNGQNFAFVGYLPVDSHERIRSIKKLESRSFSENQSQIFIETPYRNNQLIKDLLSVCSDQTLLCIATEITSAQESIQTQSIAWWKKQTTDFHKKPVIFILHKPV